MQARLRVPSLGDQRIHLLAGRFETIGDLCKKIADKWPGSELPQASDLQLFCGGKELDRNATTEGVGLFFNHLEVVVVDAAAAAKAADAAAAATTFASEVGAFRDHCDSSSALRDAGGVLLSGGQGWGGGDGPWASSSSSSRVGVWVPGYWLGATEGHPDASGLDLLATAMESDCATLLAAEGDGLEATLEKARAAEETQQRRGNIEDANVELTRENDELKAILAATQAHVQQATADFNAQTAATLAQVREQQHRLEAAGPKNRTVREIFASHNFPATGPDGVAIEEYIQRKTFRECLVLPPTDAPPTDYQRKLINVTEAFLYHSCGELNQNASLLFDLVAQRRPGTLPALRAGARAIAISPIVVSIVEAAKAAIEAKLPQGAVAKILAPLTVQYTQNELKTEHGLNLSNRQWHYARWHKEAWGAMGDAPSEKVWLQRGELEPMMNMLRHIEKHVQTIAWGTGELEGPGGAKLVIPKYIRTEARGEMFGRYAAEEKAAGRKPKSKSGFVKLMKKLAKSDPQALSALDPGSVKGKEAISRLKTDHLKELLARIPDAQLSGEARVTAERDVAASLDLSLKAIAGMEKHLAACTAPTCRSHCFTCQLCDPTGKDPTLAAPCTHDHAGRCSTCEAPRIARAQLEGLMSLLPSTAGAQDEPKAHRDIRGLVKRDLGHMDHYHAHEVSFYLITLL
jgi:hypothetical protein